MGATSQHTLSGGGSSAPAGGSRLRPPPQAPLRAVGHQQQQLKAPAGTAGSWWSPSTCRCAGSAVAALWLCMCLVQGLACTRHRLAAPPLTAVHSPVLELKLELEHGQGRAACSSRATPASPRVIQRWHVPVAASVSQTGRLQALSSMGDLGAVAGGCNHSRTGAKGPQVATRPCQTRSGVAMQPAEPHAARDQGST